MPFLRHQIFPELSPAKARERINGAWQLPRSLDHSTSPGKWGRGPARLPPGVGFGTHGRWRLERVDERRCERAAPIAARLLAGRAAGRAYRRSRPPGRAPNAAAAAAAARGGGHGGSHARPGPGAFSARRGSARHRRGGRAVIRVIARLPARASSGPLLRRAGPGGTRPGLRLGAPQPLDPHSLRRSDSALLAAPAQKGLLESALWENEERRENWAP